MTQTLTEQLENRTLPDGLYWSKKWPEYGEPNIEIVGIAGSYLPTHYEEIIAPVPSYEEWQALQKQLEIAREALKFYAEGGHIDMNLPDSDDYILMKRLYFSAAIEIGQKAREALKIGEKE